MFNRNKYYEWLPAYLEGGLTDTQKAQMEARLAADLALALEAERLRRTARHLQAARARELPAANAAVPGDLWQKVSRRLETAPPAPSAAPRRWMAGVGAAAALSLAAALWLPVGHAPVKPSAGKPKIAAPKPPVQSASAPKENAAPPLSLSAPGPFAAPPPPPPAKTAAAAPSLPAPVLPASAPPLRTAERPAPQPGPAAKPERMASRLEERRRGEALLPGNSVGRFAPPAPAAAAPLPLPAPPPAAPPLMANRGMANRGDVPRTPLPQEIVPQQGLLKALPNNLSQSQGQTDSTAIAGAAPQNARAADQFAPRPKLDDWQSALSAAVQPPLWGENTGKSQANQALMSARLAGQWDTLRTRLEARREASPQDILTGRMLAAVYEFGGQGDLSLRERRRITGLTGAGGEDWFALAQAEESAGNGQAARAAYRQALESPVPPSAFHAALARQRE